MIRKKKNKKKTFVELSNRRRRTLRFRVKRSIEKVAPVLGGLFYTYDYMHGKNSYVDCEFLGKDNKTFYNCTIQTTRDAYRYEVYGTAKRTSFNIVPADYDHIFNDKNDNVERPDPDGPNDYFGGLSRYEWISEQCRLIADERTVQVFEEVTLHYDYRCGIGLVATLDVPYITVDVLNNFIRCFLETEKPYRKETALSYSYDEVDWESDHVACVDPLEHPPVNQGS